MKTSKLIIELVKSLLKYGNLEVLDINDEKIEMVLVDTYNPDALILNLSTGTDQP